MLGLILFLLYTVDIIEIANRHDLSPHSYADDTQLKFYAKPKDCLQRLLSLKACVKEISEWISSNWLKINTDKMQFIWLGTHQQLAKINCATITLAGNVIKHSADVTVLGVVLDHEMTFATHIRRLAGRCFYQLHQLRSVRSALTLDVSKTVVHAFVSSRVDYCNSDFSQSCTRKTPMPSSVRSQFRCPSNLETAEIRPYNRRRPRSTALATIH